MTRLIVEDGIVLSKRGVSEATTLVAVLTAQQGLLRASAKSARRERSKLRYALEPLTSARFSFVRGTYEWKLVGAESVSRDCKAAPAKNRAAAGRIAKLLLRLIHGEERSPALFAALRDGVPLVMQAQGKEELESIECVLVLRILFSLGYLPRTPELAPFINDEGLSVELAAKAAANRSALIRAINESLMTSGL